MTDLPTRAAKLAATITQRADQLEPIRRQWEGTSPTVFLSKESRKALQGKISRLGINYVRLAVISLAERLQIVGFTRDGAVMPETWQRWNRAHAPELAELVHNDRALYGKAFVTVWAERWPGTPTVIGDSPRTMAVERDPFTGDPTMALRVWTEGNKSYAVSLEPSRVIRYVAPAGGSFKESGREPNPLGVVPVVEMTRSLTLSDRNGTSYAADILDITSALAKIMSDALVTSEYYAQPRRWATGLEIQEDEDGKPIDPFGESRLLQSESADTKFGQLAPASVSSYSDLIATLTQQIGALTGLPAHYLGLHGDQPASADGVKAAEAQLVERVIWEQRRLSAPWGKVAAYIDAVQTASPVAEGYRAEWANPEQRTPAQAADAAGKLATIGLPLATLLRDPLRYTPEEAARIIAERDGDIGALLRNNSVEAIR